MTLIGLSGALLLAAVALFAYALAAVRVPQHRAALENLVRAETGLDVRFSELTLRWGWYGPEAVLRDVELGEPGQLSPLLTAPELVAGVDLWPLLRRGELQVDRLTLVSPEIDLTRAAPVRAVNAPRARASTPGTLVLPGWRGTRIDIEGGTVRLAPARVPLALGIRRMTLRRSGANWSAEARLTLPETLGATAHAMLNLSGDPALPPSLGGTLLVSGTRLELSGWRAALASVPGAQFLPAAGSANVTVQLELAHGGLARAEGSVQAEGLAWPAAGPGAGLALERLHAAWHLARSGEGWHLAVDPLELERPGHAPAALSLDAADDAVWVRGTLKRAPVAVLAALARGLLPELRLSGLELGGIVREASFDWSAGRAAAARLRTTAELHGLTIGSPGSALVLAGLDARLSSEGRSLRAELHSLNAHLTRTDEPGFGPVALAVSARLDLEDNGHTWRLSTRDLELREADGHLTGSGTLAGDDSGAPPLIAAHASLSGARVELLRGLLGPHSLESLGAAAAQLTAGRIEAANLSAHGPLGEPLPWRAPHAEFSGSLVLSGATLAGGDDWPELHELRARIGFRAARVRAWIEDAAAGGFRASAVRGEWDAGDARPLHLSGRLAGRAEEALAWLRSHPQLNSYAPGLGSVKLYGDTLLDFEVRRAAAPAAPAPPRFTTRVTALLDGARLAPMAGVPAIETLRGTLAFADGHLLRSTLTGKWLGGPIALNVGERRERGATGLAISGRGLLDVQQALLAATGVNREGNAVEGNAEWSAELRLLGAAGGQGPRYRARADSSLVGLTSRLPEPFDKRVSGSPLALHLELAATDETAELRLALGERLRGLAALRRRGELWQIERGAVNLAADTPALPAEPVVRVEGTVGRLDLPACAVLWRQLTRDPAWPALRAELTASELLAAGRSFGEVRLSAESGVGLDRLRLTSRDLEGAVRWPAAVDASHPVVARLARLNVGLLAAVPGAAGLMAALAPATQLSIDDFEWQGRSLGALSATLAAGTGVLDVTDLRLSGAGDDAGAALHCQAGLCRATFRLASRDAPELLAQSGFRPDLAASRAVASGELEWPAQAAVLAELRGRLHIELEDGLMRGAAAAAAPGTPVGLLAVPGLAAGMGLPELRFTRLTADFALADGQAVTSDLHLDGPSEILVRGRIGLIARDYDAQVFLLKGEERLPAAVRGLSPGPRVAALWLSLRELFGGAGVDRGHAVLRLRGTWDDPMVTVSD